MRQMEKKQVARKKALEDEAERLDSALELAQQKCRRSGARKRLFEKEFESLKMGLDERRIHGTERQRQGHAVPETEHAAQIGDLPRHQ